jgi:hypothetical protein
MDVRAPCPFATSIAACHTFPNPGAKPKVFVTREQLREMKLVDAEKRPVERKGLGENVDTYA